MLQKMLRFFDLRDLQKEEWKRLAQLFFELAEILSNNLPENDRAKAAMVNLLNAKDDAVRALIEAEDDDPKTK